MSGRRSIAMLVTVLLSIAATVPAPPPPPPRIGVSDLEIIIPPDDFQRELVVRPRPESAARGWDAERIDLCCRQLMLQQIAAGRFNPNHIVFYAKFLGSNTPVALSDLAASEVRPITFVPQEALRDLADRLTGKSGRAADEALPEVGRLRGRAKNILPLLLPAAAAGRTGETYRIWYA